VTDPVTNGEPISLDPNEASSRFIGTTSLTDIYRANTPGQSNAKIVKGIVTAVRSSSEKTNVINSPETEDC